MARPRVSSAIVVAASLLATARLIALPRAANVTTGCVESFDAGRDYFPDKVAITEASNFRVEYHDSYKAVTVKSVDAGIAPERYVLMQCGAPVPPQEAAATIVRVPAASVFAASTSQLGALAELDRLDVLTGVSRLRDLTGEKVLRRAATGRIREFAASSVVDTELVMAARPSLLMTTGAARASPVLRAAGVPVIATTEWLEPTPLARAEWIKFIALFLNEERQATAFYDAMKARYRALGATARAASLRPLVMTGRSTNGRFVIAGGRSYVASLIADAGGRYVWSDNTATGTAAVDLEAQIRRAAAADIWINGGGWASLARMLDDEPRYAAFRAFRHGQVWVYERRLQPSGANEYWTRSVWHPDLVVSDLVRILHPALLEGRPFEWYMKVPPS